VEQVPWARDLARRLLAEPLPRRWAHTQGVARKAQSIAHIVGEDAELLICAAWLHDIGYSPDLATTGFHPLDGARFLRDSENADDKLCRLVAHHSCALVEAKHRGLLSELVNEFPSIGGTTLDGLTYCDMTTGPKGTAVDGRTRLTEIAIRYGDDHMVTKAIRESRPQILAAIHRIELISANCP
jgi:putative nucleotidyltransferase with HDIG domain